MTKNYTTVTVDVDVDISEFDDVDLIHELESREYEILDPHDKYNRLTKEDIDIIINLIDCPAIGSDTYFLRDKLLNISTPI